MVSGSAIETPLLVHALWRGHRRSHIADSRYRRSKLRAQFPQTTPVEGTVWARAGTTLSSASNAPRAIIQSLCRAMLKSVSTRHYVVPWRTDHHGFRVKLVYP